MHEQSSSKNVTLRRGRSGGRRWPAARALSIACALLSIGACAPHRNVRPVPIDERPTPVQPGATDSGTSVTTPPNGTQQPPTPEARWGRVVQDTLMTHATLERCANRRLLPEQESTVDAVRQLLSDTNAALVHEDLARAESLARRALLLSRSLNCP